MVQTYAQLQKQIEKLQKQAVALRQTEVKGVIERIKVAIAHYGLTADQLGLGTTATRAIGARLVRAKRDTAAPTTAKFTDGPGRNWSGRGPRPRWLRDALTAGRSLEEFKARASTLSPPAASPDSAFDAPTGPVTTRKSSPKAPAKTTAKKARNAAKVVKPTIVRYADDAGHTWSGRGPTPAWLKDAVAAGKALSDFQKQV